MNSLVHGIRGEELAVLPHENSAEVLAYIEMWMNDLHLEGPVEVQVGKSIAFKSWQKKRIETVEARRQQAEVLHRLEDTPAMNNLHLFEGAILALKTMVAVMGSSIPEDRESLDKLLTPVSGVLEMMEKVESTAANVFVGLSALTDAIDKLKTCSHVTTDVLAYTVVIEKTQSAVGAVEALLPEAQRAVEEAKLKVTSDMPMAADRDAMLRHRYWKELGRRIESELRVLGQLRERRTQLAASGSLGQAAHVEVRVVG
jgi:hypothetical protein